jgi:DNA-binding transcriptional ArsR family regulator
MNVENRAVVRGREPLRVVGTDFTGMDHFCQIARPLNTDVGYCFMLTYTLTEEDLASVRFGISPLCEMGLSLRAIKDPARFPLQLPWLRRIEAAWVQLDVDVLSALIDERLWTPDLLNPRPVSPLTRIDQELDAFRATDPREFIRQVEALHGELPQALKGDPAHALHRTAQALEGYWDSCFRPHWNRMRALLEADIAHRGRQIARSGLSAMLNTISPTVSFARAAVSIRLRNPVNISQPVDGQGITLVPTIFTDRASAPTDATEPPMILYEARGQGAMWEPETLATDAGAIRILGLTRAALLTALSEPASSTELGMRMGVTTSAVNQHLRALQVGRLVNSTRHGRSMLYFRSELGSAVLGSDATI